ncbi:hypothetical protein GCM10007424_03140 [Flavobacterium suaedae]|uniref:DUF559 domain-containing protein n=1 Tax=Flavobacterium suaedae TaxID=1767027 RepID=A0ABQ1JGE3_9FLAO|nr:hypothetical protein GCM10007424_03140 [Flavobacterium suaedae]
MERIFNNNYSYSAATKNKALAYLELKGFSIVNILFYTTFFNQNTLHKNLQIMYANLRV